MQLIKKYFIFSCLSFATTLCFLNCTNVKSYQIQNQVDNKQGCVKSIAGFEQITPSGIAQLIQKKDGTTGEVQFNRRIFYILITQAQDGMPAIDSCIFMGKKTEFTVDTTPSKTPLIVKTLNGLPGGFTSDTLFERTKCNVWAINIPPYTSSSSSKLIYSEGILVLYLKENNKPTKLILKEFKPMARMVTQ